MAGVEQVDARVALVPASFKRLRLGGVSCRPLLGRAEHTAIALCYRSEALSPAAAGFIRLARELAVRANRRSTPIDRVTVTRPPRCGSKPRRRDVRPGFFKHSRFTTGARRA